MKTGSHLGAALLLAISCWSASANAGNYQVHELVRGGYDQVWLRDVNNSGQMLGASYSGTAGRTDVFIYSAGVFTDLPQYNDAGWGLSVRGLSDSGVVVGMALQANGAMKGVIYENNSYQSFKPDDASDAQLLGISPDGRYITGQALNRVSEYRLDVLYSFVLDRSTGQLTKIDITQRPFISLRGINNAGVIAGSAGAEGGVLYDMHTGSNQFMGSFNGRATLVNDVSDTGFIAAMTQWLSPDYILESNALAGRPGALERLDLPGAAFAYGVNDSGTVVGAFSPDSDLDQWVNHAFYAVSSVPEPNMPALWLGGCMAVAAAVRRMRLQA